MTPTPSIDELAKAAIEAQELLKKTGAPFDVAAVKLRRDLANHDFHNAATPEAWLSLSSRVEALEDAVAHASVIEKLNNAEISSLKTRIMVLEEEVIRLKAELEIL